MFHGKSYDQKKKDKTDKERIDGWGLGPLAVARGERQSFSSIVACRPTRCMYKSGLFPPDVVHSLVSC